MMSSPFIALLPMKKHSARVPDKNKKLLAGKPLCFWILETLHGIDEIGKVIINTDSEELAEMTQKKSDKVQVHWRPDELCGDFVSMNHIIAYDLAQFPGHQDFIQTHSTNPFLSQTTLQAAAQEYLDPARTFDSIFSVTRHQSRFFDTHGQPINHNPNELKRTQDLPPLYEENSNFYMFSQDSFSLHKQRIGIHPKMFEVPALEAVDIDDASDWQIAELLAQQEQQARAPKSNS